ncbi:MAG: RNA methyltransferase [Bacteroidales bacterium]|nr:RNA methyltransferase [Bacteroidales bacterium]MDD4672300.1 RNA methyltransferase [Bacteroidales bacterium]
MITTNEIKFIKSLQQKKFRRQHGLFVAEGAKLVEDILGSNLKISAIYHTASWNNYPKAKNFPFTQVSKKEMGRISSLSTPSEVIALGNIPIKKLDVSTLKGSLSLMLDTVQDPGNMGTIIRLADWFGITNIVCSPTSADAFAPKVIQATMGAIARVSIYYANLEGVISEANILKIPTYGTFLNGNNLYTSNLTPTGIIVMGNEGYGISQGLENLINHKLTIPNFSNRKNTSESLNVAMATAIICSEFKRKVTFP